MRASGELRRAGALRLIIWLVYGALFALSVPWYLPADAAPALWFGLPYWVVLSLFSVFGVSCFSLWAIPRLWPAAEDDEEPTR